MTTTTVPKLFGLSGDAWMRHANPASVWTRFAALPLLALSVWSRAWLGWFCLVPVGLALLWTVVNPRFFRPPRSTDNWASKAVLGERLWTERAGRSASLNVAQGFQVAGLAVMAYGLIVFDLVAVGTGVLLAQVAKLWYLDRMALLYEAVSS